MALIVLKPPSGKTFSELRSEAAAKNLQAQSAKIKERESEAKNFKKVSDYHRDMTTVHKV